MKNYLFLFIILFQSCNSLEGELHNFNKISLLNSKGKLVELKKGLLPVEIELKSNRLLVLKTTDQIFKFKIPKGYNIPDGDGEVRLESWQVGQPVGVYARVRSNTFRGELILDSEECTWTERYDICDASGVCRVSYRTREGSREVTYRNDTHEKRITLNLILDLSGAVLSQFLGEIFFVKKIYTYESSCI